jgi:hypothetical protein
MKYARIIFRTEEERPNDLCLYRTSAFPSLEFSFELMILIIYPSHEESRKRETDQNKEELNHKISELRKRCFALFF